MSAKGEWMIPIHWGAFKLAFHDWTDPIDRIINAAKERGVAVASPRIGEPVRLHPASTAIPKVRTQVSQLGSALTTILGRQEVRFTLRVPFTWTDGTFDKFDLPR